MARTVIPAISIYPGDVVAIALVAYGVNLNVVWFAPADAVEGNAFWATGREVLLARNADGAPHAMTIISVPDPYYNRTGDISAYSLGPAEYAVFPPFFKREGWAQPNGCIYLDADNSEIQFAVLKILEDDMSLGRDMIERGSLWFDEVKCSGHLVTIGA